MRAEFIVLCLAVLVALNGFGGLAGRVLDAVR